VQVSFRGDAFLLPRPNLLGAIMIKAAASRHANRPKDHRDLAHLIAKVDDPIAVRNDLRGHERRLLADRLAHRLVAAELAEIGRNATAKIALLAAEPKPTD
jgi:hypothetical protein